MPGAGAARGKRRVYWAAQALEDLAHWDKTDRRITKEHRLVYRVEDDTVYIAQCRYHY